MENTTNVIKILIVDDQEGIRQLLTEACALLGYEAKTAANGDEALQLIGQEDFQVALVDLKMGGLNGFETMKRLKEKRKDMRGVFMSGYGLREMEGNYILNKPFDLQEMEDVLEKVLNN
ncbi:MAG: response regulator [Peptococcia bacterium]|jgi:two-component system response regulator (stage 0 sporulation protein F)